MDYFDNGPLIESITETTAINPGTAKSNIGWWIAGLIIVGCIAGVYFYKYKRLKKESKKQS